MAGSAAVETNVTPMKTALISQGGWSHQHIRQHLILAGGTEQNRGH